MATFTGKYHVLKYLFTSHIQSATWPCENQFILRSCYLHCSFTRHHSAVEGRDRIFLGAKSLVWGLSLLRKFDELVWDHQVLWHLNVVRLIACFTTERPFHGQKAGRRRWTERRWGRERFTAHTADGGDDGGNVSRCHCSRRFSTEQSVVNN